MFNRRTLFIIGAGASAEVGFPVGKTLAETIGKKADIRLEHGFKPIGLGDLELFSQITQNRRVDVNEYQYAGWRIRDGVGFAQSIDDFLDQHRSDQRINLYGKAALVQAILEAERKSKLFFEIHNPDTRFTPDKFADTWFVKFMYMLGRGVPKENVREIFDHVSFIVFNYDRCLEHFLRFALQKVYGIDDDEARDIVSDLTVIHPYGVVSPKIPFGHTSANYVELASKIKTYTEQLGAADIISEVREEIIRAECIVFLGFAYHSQNMLILKPATTMPHKPIFGTAYNMSESDVRVVLHDLSNSFFAATMLEGLIRLENKLTAAALFDNYAKSLTGGD
jgi:hypothetical protein